ncbi:MAG: hypothetical protein QM783_01575 [Phycisphaerales bacterium]
MPAGAYTVDTDALTISGAQAYTGVLSPDGDIAVFAFNGLSIAGATFTVTGKRPCAFLSQSDLVASSSFDASGGAGGNSVSNPSAHGGVGGTGRGGGANGGGGGSVGQFVFTGLQGNGVGGGSTANGGQVGGQAGWPGSFGSVSLGGGQLYGNLCVRLEGGSGGGGGGAHISASGAGGGAGGGAIEFGAVGLLDLRGSTINVDGGNGGAAAAPAGRGGGGSGGGVLMHAATVYTPQSITARGGVGSWRAGGGRVALLSANTPDINTVDTSGYDTPGPFTNLRTGLTAANLDFGDVPVGSSKTLGLMVSNTGAPETSINGRFPAPSGGPLTRVSNADLFSGLHGGQWSAMPYTFTPTAVGPFSQTVTIVSTGGNATVTITGRGVTTQTNPAPVCMADLGVQGGGFGHDGELDNNDFVAFINAFFNHTGCP